MNCHYSFFALHLTHYFLPYITKDERIRSLDQLPRYGSHASVLTKMYTEQILRREELTIFEASLMPHQKAVSHYNAALFIMLKLPIPFYCCKCHVLLIDVSIADNISMINDVTVTLTLTVTVTDNR